MHADGRVRDHPAGRAMLLIDGQLRITHSEVDRMIEAVVDPNHALAI